jgi:hypothetical protein
MQLMSGQTTQVPVAQISRMGYRKRDGEPDEWTFEKPMVHLRSGERMLVNIPTSTVDVLTRYGSLKLSPQSISAIVFQSDDNGVHDILLTDGSKFAGLASADHFDMQLVGTATQQSVSFPSAILARVQFSKPLDSDLDDDDPTLVLSNKDLFVGTLAGELKLDTNFDTITINAAEMRSLTHAAEAGMDVQVTLWDQTTLSGQLRQPEVTCNLKSGVNVKIPLAMVDRYSNPMPQPSAIMVDRIKAIVAELNAQDFKQRDRAEAQLVSMGPVVAGVLKELSPTQTAEAQNRIEAVLRQLEKKPDVSGVPAPGN